MTSKTDPAEQAETVRRIADSDRTEFSLALVVVFTSSAAMQRASEESRNESRTRENIFPVDDAINDERLRKVPTCPTVLSLSQRFHGDDKTAE